MLRVRGLGHPQFNCLSLCPSLCICVCMYVCMWVWVPGGVVVRPWAHNRKVESSSLAHAPVEMWCSYSFSITIWCEKSIQHQPTSSPSCKWEPGIFWGANSLAVSHTPAWANFFFGRGFNLEIFLNLQGSEFIQTLLFIYNHLAKFVVYKSWTRSALLKGTSKCFLVSSITCRNEEAIEWVWFEYKL